MRPAVAAAVTALVAGCGSTVVIAPSLPGSAAVGGTNGSGVGTGPAAGGLTVPRTTAGGSVGSGATGVSGAAATTGGVVPGGSAPGSTGGSQSAPAPSSLSPRSTSPIQVGFQVTSDLNAGFAATGATGTAPDEEPMVRALEKWVNSTGGIGGRRLDVVIHHTAITRGTFSQQAEEACTDFLQDHHVLVVASSPVDASDDLTNCVAGHHVPIIVQDLWPYDDTYYRKYPDLIYSPGRASPDRWAQPAVDVLRSGGYFSAGKVGLVRFDDAVYTRMGDRLDSALSRRGLSFTKEVAIGTPGSLSDFGAMSAAISNAIVQFRSAGVDHVMFAASGELPFFFMTNAESQHYRPRYGLTTNDVPDTQVTRGVPPAQLVGALAAGWQPANDLGDTHYHNHNAAWKLCDHIMRKYGAVSNGFYSDSHCDSMFFIRRALTGLSTFSPAGMAGLVARFGTSYVSPLTFGTAFGPGRFDGASEIRLAAYQSGCGCFTYTGPLQPM